MRRATLFIVEDEIIIAIDLKRKLESKGYTVLGIASSGEEAVKKVLELRPELVLMDIHLRGQTDGIEAAAQIQSGANIPVIYLTAYADTSTLARAKITGPYGYILKPYEERELEVNIEINLQKNRLDQELRETAENLTHSLKELERSNAFIGALGQVAARIQQNLHPVKIVKTLGEELELLGIHCAVLLYDQENDQKPVVYYVSLPADQTNLLEQKIGAKLLGFRLEQESLPSGSFSVSDAQLILEGSTLNQVFGRETIAPFIQVLQTDLKPGEIQFLYLPLAFAERIFGGLLVWGAGFFERDAPAMKVFANQFAIAMETSRLFLQTQHISNTDPLTGTYNRRYFLDYAQRAFDLFQRHGHEFSLIMLDLDFFKEVNDRYGHLTGDQVLNQVVQRIHGELRSSDVLARFGGEEFIVLLPETGIQQAMQAAERIREVICKTPIPSGAERITVSASLGVTQMDATIHSLESLIHYSDQALYCAKAEGRNCVRAA